MIDLNQLFQSGAASGEVIKWSGSAWVPDTDNSGAGSTDLAFTGASSPVTLTSSTGTDVTFTAGTGITLAGTGTDLTINATGGYSAEQAQDDVLGVITSSATITFTYDDALNDAFMNVITQMSVTSDASGVKLVNDETSPGNSEYYGTNGSGTKGWYALPAGGAPAGANYQVQYYDTGAFAADADFNFDPTNNRLVVGTITPTATIHARAHADTGVAIFKGENLTGNDVMAIYANGYWKFGDNETYPRFYQSATAGGAVSYTANGINANISFATTGTEDGFSVFHPSFAPTADTKNVLNVSGTFAPTSGSAVYNSVLIAPTINQTGGANGVTRGVYINPTLTAASNFTSLEVAGTTKSNHFQGRGSAPSVSVNTGVCGTGATATVSGNDSAFEVTVNFGSSGFSGSTDAMFTVTYNTAKPNTGVVVFSPGDDAGIAASLINTANPHIANADNTDFQMWTAAGIDSSYASTVAKFNFIVVSK